MDFIKDQWYVYDNYFWQFVGVSKTGKNQFRYAGDDCNIYIGVEDKLKPSSLLPNFRNAKVGDECFSVEEGICKIMDSKSDSLIAAMNKSGGWDAFTMNGKLEPESTHPLLFNSFAQFTAYWAEEWLKMKGGKSD